jgi:hypothetical protein
VFGNIKEVEAREGRKPEMLKKLHVPNLEEKDTSRNRTSVRGKLCVNLFGWG